MPFYVYALYSPEHDKLYIGYTSDIESRFRSHNELATKGWTVQFSPWVLIYTEQFESKVLAMKREKELKTFRGREFLRTKIL